MERKTQSLIAGMIIIAIAILLIWGLITVYNQKLEKEDIENEFRSELNTKISIIEGNNDRIDVNVRTIKSNLEEIETKVNSQKVETIDYEKIKNEILSYSPIADCVQVQDLSSEETTFYCKNR